MANQKRRLVIEQLDSKLVQLGTLKNFSFSTAGWIKTMRQALNISLKQLSKRLSVTFQNVKQLEERELDGSISINKLKQTAEALDMEFVYAFIPRDGSLSKLIERRAFQKAKEIVLRTSHTMQLEDQGNTDQRIQTAIKEKADEIKREMPKYLWD